LSLRLRFLIESSRTAPLGTQVRELQEVHLKNKEVAQDHPIVMILTFNPCHLNAAFRNLQDGSIVRMDIALRILLD
jgi:hypothetical protein